MKKDSVINIVAVQCRPEVEEKFRKWYSEVHVPLLLKYKGLKAVTQFELTKADDKYPGFLAIYEFDNQEDFDGYERSPELAESRKQADEKLGGRRPRGKMESTI